jgi:hypothetical protein
MEVSMLNGAGIRTGRSSTGLSEMNGSISDQIFCECGKIEQ